MQSIRFTALPSRSRFILSASALALITAFGATHHDAQAATTAASYAATIQAATTNLALNKPTTASSIQSASYPASAAVDGNAGTRWSSAWSDAQWFQVDLGANTTINSVSLSWEGAYAKAYSIQVSTDNSTWRTVYSTTTSAGGNENRTFTATTARFVRISMSKRATTYGYSLYEMGVFNDGTVTPAPTGNALPTDSVFAPNSFWYTPIPANAPLHANSAKFTTEFQRQVKTYYNNVALNTTSYSSPVYIAAAGTATKKVQVWDCQGKGFSDANLQSQWSAVPIPNGAKPSAGTDGEMTVYQPSTNTIWEFWQTKTTSGGWQACWGGRMQNVKQNQGIWPNPYGTTATGLPFLGGQITAEELQRGEIRHAIGIALVDLEKSSVVSWPATRSDGYNPNNAPNRIPEGLRFRLDPTLNVDALNIHKVAKIIAKAAQKYGFVVWDKAGAVSMRLQNPLSYTSQGKANPYPALFGSTPDYAVMNGFPWNRLQFMPLNYGKQ